VNAAKRNDLLSDTLARQEFVDLVKTDVPSLRELRIQMDKLRRLLSEGKHEHEAARAILSGGSVKKARKRAGKRAQEISMQANKTVDLFEKFVREAMRKFNNNKPVTKEQWRAAMRAIEHKFLNRIKYRRTDLVPLSSLVGKPKSAL